MNSIKPGFDTSTQNEESNNNYKEEILQTRDFGSNPNGQMFGQSVMPTNAPIECNCNYPILGAETNFGNNPDGEMFGAPAVDKLEIIEQSFGWKSESETMQEESFDSLTLEHDLEEGTRGPILPEREF